MTQPASIIASRNEAMQLLFTDKGPNVLEYLTFPEIGRLQEAMVGEKALFPAIKEKRDIILRENYLFLSNSQSVKRVLGNSLFVTSDSLSETAAKAKQVILEAFRTLPSPFLLLKNQPGNLTPQKIEQACTEFLAYLEIEFAMNLMCDLQDLKPIVSPILNLGFSVSDKAQRLNEAISSFLQQNPQLTQNVTSFRKSIWYPNREDIPRDVLPSYINLFPNFPDQISWRGDPSPPSNNPPQEVPRQNHQAFTPNNGMRVRSGKKPPGRYF